MSNLDLYNKVRTVPPEAMKKITGGRLTGKTDINPMWRIKVLTELLGPAGIGWKIDIAKYEYIPVANGEVVAVVFINLYVKNNDEWSGPIPGVGGNMLIEKESKGLHNNDEAFKMAYTDAMSVACKALGIGADVYWCNDNTKYSTRGEPVKTGNDLRQTAQKVMTGSESEDKKEIIRIKAKLEVSADDFKTACENVKGIKADLLNFWRSCEDDNLTAGQAVERSENYQDYIDNKAFEVMT